MPDDFQQTVDLSEKPVPKDKVVSEPKKIKKIIRKKRLKRKAEGIDEVFNDDEDVQVQPGMQTIDRPEPKKQSDDEFFKKVTVILSLVLVVTLAYFLFFKKEVSVDNCDFTESSNGWYGITLVNKEEYYGQIQADKACSDPVVIKNVYYNYDQLNKETNTETGETKNLRLVKRGQETHGPDGTLSLTRSQILFIEPLKENSNVLKAILDYEN